MGNALGSRPTGVERQHKYGDVEIEDEGNLGMGDMSTEEITAFFARAAPSGEMLERARLASASNAKLLERKSG